LRIDIDEDTPQLARDHANALINRELRKVDMSNPHPSLPAVDEPKFSELVTAELERIESGKKKRGGVDMSRYEPPDVPGENADVNAWRDALKSAYSSSTYLSGRQVNLKLLEESGKNAWLISNSQLDQSVKSYQTELDRLKQETESVNKERKGMQESSKAELDALEEAWKTGLGKLVEVQLGSEQLRRELQRAQMNSHR
jgi:pre-mRNA-splicing factor SPF27